MKKSNTLLKIVNLFFLVLGCFLFVHSLFPKESRPSVFASDFVSIFDLVVGVFAYIAALFYLISGYKKDAARYYKIFMTMVLITTVITAINVMGNNKANLLTSTLIILLVVLTTIMATGKDIGKIKSYYIAIGVVFIQILLIVEMIVEFDTSFILFRDALLYSFCKLVLFVTAGLLVAGKYSDKDSRGAR